MKKSAKNYLRNWLIALLPAALGTFLYFFSAGNRSFANWYVRKLHPLLVGTVGRVNGIFPFSVNEMLIYLLIAAAVFWVIRDVSRLLRKRTRAGFAGRWLRMILVAGGSVWLLFMIGCGINYNRSTFAEESGMETVGGTSEELRVLCEIIIEECNRRADLVTRDESGIMQLEEDYRAGAVLAMKNLGQAYDTLSGFYPQPKPVFFSEFMSHEHITGVHSPYTSEAQYNRLITPYNIPHTICHELAHLKGYMREDEANFVGFLACIGSDRIDFQYSGYALAYIYTTNALYGADYEAWDTVRKTLDAKIGVDLSENSRYWSRYQTKLAEIKESANDTYLKFNHQDDGVKSYGRVVDLMLGYYREEIEARLAKEKTS